MGHRELGGPPAVTALALTRSPVHVTVAGLIPWERNPRRIDRAEFEALVESIRREPDLMWARPLIVRTDHVVLAGSMRLRAVERLGWQLVPAVVVEADERRSIEIAVRDNSHSGEWNEELLAELLADIGDPSSDEAMKEIAGSVGMTEREVIRLYAAPESAPEPEWSQRRCPACGHHFTDGP